LSSERAISKPVRRSTLPIFGISCSNCALAIEWAVGILPGVAEAQVDSVRETLAVRFDPGEIEEAGIIGCVRRLGYGVPVAGGASASSRGRHVAPGGTSDGDRRARELARQRALVVLGSSVAYLSSLAVTLGLVHNTSVYHETGATIITLVRLGKYLESRARQWQNCAAWVLSVVMMTGDLARSADAIARQVGIDRVLAGVAMATAGVTLVSGDLRGVGRAIRLSRGSSSRPPWPWVARSTAPCPGR
jgi:cation transport ATPase